MSDTVVLSTPGAARSGPVIAREERVAELAGARLVGRLDHGIIARIPSGAPFQFNELSAVRYVDTNILQIAGRRIDVEAGVRLSAEDDVPGDARDTWPLHVLQLAAPAFPEWVREIEATGVTVIERVGRYGVQVHGSPAQVDSLRRLPFVSWAGALAPGWKIDPRLLGQVNTGEVSVTVYPPTEMDAVAAFVEAQGATVLRRAAPLPGRHVLGARLTVRGTSAQARAFAQHPAVRSVAWEPPVSVGGEREVQILTESFNGAAAPATGPVPGYGAWLTALGANGNGVTVAVVDSGVDTGANNNTTGHLDLRGRQTAWFDYNGVPQDSNGHGTHVTAIAVGNAATGTTEAAAPNNFLWGQGAAPAANFVAQSVANPANPAGTGLVIPAPDTLTTDAANSGATVQNNSWSGDGSPNTYTQREADYDALVRDANPTTGTADALTVVFAASNAGGLAGTIGDPSSAKNLICVGNALSARPGLGFPDDDIRGIRGTSSRGPASGGRLKPDIVAPGTDVSAALSSASASAPIAGAPTYTTKTGTSQAAPHVTGMCAVLTEWWRNRTGGKTPSPAMLKALLVNGAEDLVGGSNWRRVVANSLGANRFSVVLAFTPTRVVVPNVTLNQVASVAALVNNSWCFNAATQTLTVQFVSADATLDVHAQDGVLPHIPNNDQGWGRVSLDNIVYQSPDSDRGPRLFIDQRHAFTASGQSHTWRVRPVDSARPMRVTLAYTDAPGAVNDATPLVNDLDLRVRRTSDNATFRGNPANFANGFTNPGGVADNTNNVECVYIQNPAGVFEVTVRATTLTTNARPPFDAVAWQDYALALENAEFAAASPSTVSLLLDRSGSMVTAGYVDVTREASKLFIDLLRADDKVGVVSFGDASKDEYAPGGALATITDATQQTAARAAIDAMTFSGCTYMGAGLERAAQLIGAGPGAVVLLSDGKDNKGCAESDASRKWATAVAAALQANIDVYTCAMGPLADTAKLEQIAQVTGGQYYFMPGIDDLQEIYNYIRGNVSGDGVIVNTTGTASAARVAAQVDCDAEFATFAVHWKTPGLRWTGGDATRADQISVALRTPGGKRVPANASWVRRVVGSGYVILSVPEPEGGRWSIEVSTARQEHTPFTAGGWVRSPVKLQWRLPGRPTPASVALAHVGLIKDASQNFDVRYSVSVSAPKVTLADVLVRNKAQLDAIRPDPRLIADGYTPELARVLTLDNALRTAGRTGLFTRSDDTAQVVARTAATPQIAPVDTAVGRPGGVRIPGVSLPGPVLNPQLAALRDLSAFTHDTRFRVTTPGSYTLRIVASGVDARTGCRFVRRAAGSFVVGS